jgi:NAD(P)-dependent dehydrogenase (short-subunit alcohol dehydrogenase family)
MNVVELKRKEDRTDAGARVLGPVAVVTGAGRGIGRALVDVLKERGYTVVAVVRSLGDVAELSSIKNVIALRCDVTEPSTEAVLKEFIASRVEKVDLLINNAGFGAKSYGIEGLVYGELEDVLAVSCYGPIRCTRACLPMLRKSSRAVVLNISSRFASLEWVANGVVPHTEATYAYRIGKAAMNMFTSCLSVELRAENIKVLAVDPGKVKTRFGPKDADTEPQDAAQAIVDLVESTDLTGLFLRASGEKLPW